MVRHALLLVALTACFEDRYRCDEDADCDLGTGGRCERDGYCTSHDLDCPTARSYEEHAGSLTSTCYDDREAPLNPCAGGQPPAPLEGCFADVCARLPAFCELAWTDACVQLAQEACDVTCDTRLAITATRNGPTPTQVPVASLKSSAMRPSNSRPFAGIAGSSNFSASPSR